MEKERETTEQEIVVVLWCQECFASMEIWDIFRFIVDIVSTSHDFLNGKKGYWKECSKLQRMFMLDFDEIHMLNWSSSLSINMCCVSKSVLSYGAVIFTARKAKPLLKMGFDWVFKLQFTVGLLSTFFINRQFSHRKSLVSSAYYGFLDQ